MPRKEANDLRSACWFAPDDLRSFGHRSRVLQMGYDYEDWQGKPIIAILNTWSDMNQCHLHFKQRVEAIDINVPIGCGDAPVFPGRRNRRRRGRRDRDPRASGQRDRAGVRRDGELRGLRVGKRARRSFDHRSLPADATGNAQTIRGLAAGDEAMNRRVTHTLLRASIIPTRWCRAAWRSRRRRRG